MFKMLLGWLPSSVKQNSRVIVENPDALAKKALHAAFDFDAWYPALAKFTFDSRILPISVEIAEAMVRYYQARYDIKQQFTRVDVDYLTTLEGLIAEQLSKFNDHGVFIRMSNRSPKDGNPLIESNETVIALYREFLDKHQPSDDNKKMVILSEFQQGLLKCTTAKQVMNLLLTSERVFVDLLEALDCHYADLNDQWTTSLILREWNEALRGDFEFRIFVHERKVTGISQYNHYCQFNNLTDDLTDQQRNTLQTNLIHYVSQIDSAILPDSYVVDVAQIENKFYVVEINPFLESTGSALFSWQDDHNVLFGQINDQEPELRIRTEPLPFLSELVHYIEKEIAAIRSTPYDADYNFQPQTRLK